MGDERTAMTVKQSLGRGITSNDVFVCNRVGLDMGRLLGCLDSQDMDMSGNINCLHISVTKMRKGRLLRPLDSL